MGDFRADCLADLQAQFTKLRTTAERAIAQVHAGDFTRAPDEENNSIAITVKHIAGNLRSRMTDFLTTDGEKPDRDRDGEFELRPGDSHDQLLADWAASWDLLDQTIGALTPDDLDRTVYIRGEPHSVAKALHRNLAHLAYHVGQIVQLSRHWVGKDWRSLTIPRGQSQAFNAAKQAETASRQG